MEREPVIVNEVEQPPEVEWFSAAGPDGEIALVFQSLPAIAQLNVAEGGRLLEGPFDQMKCYVNASGEVVEYTDEQKAAKAAKPQGLRIPRWSNTEFRWFDAMDAQTLLAAKTAEVLAARAARLASSDWTQVIDSPLDEMKKAAWRVYRQALRDITNQPSFPDVTWPSPP